MTRKLTEREIFDHVFNKTKLSRNAARLLEEDPEYRELRDYYEFLKKQIDENSGSDISNIVEKIKRRIHPPE
jgi:hypothetical protein